MADLTTKTARTRLKIRPAPYFMKLRQGCFLGFRRGPDTWIARYRGPDKKQRHHALSAHDYGPALKEADEWFQTQGRSVRRSTIRSTVKDALEAYLKELDRNGRQSAAHTAKGRYELIVWSDPLADIYLDELTIDDMEEWRERIREGRQNRSVNRHVSGVVAGLNLAYRKGHAGNPEAWRLSRLTDDIEHTAETTLFITKEQRAAVMKYASDECAQFIQAIYLTGGRPKELAQAKRRDFDEKAGTLILRSNKGRPARVRPRTVLLTDGARTFFSKVARDKLPAAPLLPDPDHKEWGRHKWSDEIQLAIKKHDFNAKPGQELPKGISAYSFRHARISELLQVHQIDTFTVAQQTGTSAGMIERYYFRFISTAYRERLAGIDSNA